MAPDVGSHMTALAMWAVTALPAYLCAVRLVGRRTAPDREVPARLWLALFLGWCLLASVLGGAGLGWLAWPLLAGQGFLAVTLARKQGWSGRAATLTVAGGFAGFVLYALAGGLLLRQTAPWAAWGWWLLLPAVWVAWLRIPTVPSIRPIEDPPA